MRPSLLAACAVLIAGPALAQTSVMPAAPAPIPTAVRTVADLATVCAPPAGAAQVMRLEAIAYCQGFLTAAGQYHAALRRGRRSAPLFCPPSPPPSVAQAAAGFAAWAAQNPQRAEEPALDGLLRFAEASYPCPTPAPAARRTPATAPR